MGKEKALAKMGTGNTIRLDKGAVIGRAPGSELESKHNGVKTQQFAEANSTQLTDAEINRLGKEKYEQKFASKVNTEENKGKFFVLDVTTDEYEIGEDLILLTEHAQKRSPHAKFYLRRIGYDYIAKFL